MKKILIGGGVALLLATASVMVSCTSKSDSKADAEDPAQIENARNEGREAARSFINRTFKDSLEMQQEMVEAGIRRTKYDSLPRSREAFDSAFISTIRTVRPEVAEALARHKNMISNRPK